MRASFKLAELLPVDDNIEQERESLSAPSVKLMRTVAAAIKEDLSKVKDVLDIFVRRGGGQSSELQPQLERCRRKSATRSVCSAWASCASACRKRSRRLRRSFRTANSPSEDSLVRVAGVLLSSVEDSLDDQLVRLILPRARRCGFRGKWRRIKIMNSGRSAKRCCGECIVNLARIKEAVSTAVQKPDEFSPQGLDNVPQLLRGITADC